MILNHPTPFNSRKYEGKEKERELFAWRLKKAGAPSPIFGSYLKVLFKALKMQTCSVRAPWAMQFLMKDCYKSYASGFLKGGFGLVFFSSQLLWIAFNYMFLLYSDWIGFFFFLERN